MKRFNLKYILGLMLVVAISAPSLALAAPKKKAAPKAKAKVAVSSKKKSPAQVRAPASGKKAKSTPGKKTAPKAIAKKGTPKKITKGKAPVKSQVRTQVKSAPKASPSAFESSPKERLPTGMAGLGLGSAAGSVNSNKNFEIRGQARTLSMMLILRNGKENVNFVKVRQDYATEIAKTEF